MIDCRGSIQEVLALSEESFGFAVAELTDINAHSEARVLKAKRTGNEGLVSKALGMLWRHQNIGYKTEGDVYDDGVLDKMIGDVK